MTIASTPTNRTVVSVPLAQIDASDETYRLRAIVDVADLVASLRETPQRVPCFVARRSDGRYRIVAGFRRVRALSELGRPHALCIVVPDEPAECFALAWAENVARGRLCAEDLMYALWKAESDGRTVEEIANLFRLSPRDHQRLAAIGAMPEVIKTRIKAHGLSLRHAAVLASHLKKHRRANTEPTLAACAKEGWGAARFQKELTKALPQSGRRITGLSLRGTRLVLDRSKLDPSAIPAVQRRKVVAELEALLELLRE